MNERKRPKPPGPTLSQRVAANIKAELARVDADPRALATDLGLSDDALRRRRRGVTPWSFDEAEGVADYLGIDVETLLART